MIDIMSTSGYSKEEKSNYEVDKMFCKNCGNQLADNAKFCKFCGAKIQQKTGNTPLTETNGENKKIKVENTVATKPSSVDHNVQEYSIPKAKKKGVGKIVIFVILVALLWGMIGFAAVKIYGVITNKGENQEYSVIEEDDDDMTEESEDEEEENDAEENDKEDKTEDGKDIVNDVTETNHLESAAVVENAMEDSEDEMNIHTYQIVRENVSWSEAYIRAKEAGGYLVRINTPEEMEYILEQIYREGQEDGIYWLSGMRASNSSDYFWVDENGMFLSDVLNNSEFWLPGEPSLRDDSTNLDENVMNMFYVKKQGRFVWNDTVDNVLEIVSSYEGKICYIIEFDN